MFSMRRRLLGLVLLVGAGCAPTGGSSPGTAGNGGSGATAGTTGSGATTGTGGATAGTGGSATGTSGRGGSTGGATSTGGRGGTAGGAGTTGSAGSGGATANGDDYVSNVQVTVHATTKTILVVTWTQLKAADTTSLEFSFAGSSVMKSRAIAGATGAHRDVVLGVPGSTPVTLHIVSRVGGVDYKTKDYQGTTGAVPSGMPKSVVMNYDATRASPDRYMFG